MHMVLAGDPGLSSHGCLERRAATRFTQCTTKDMLIQVSALTKLIPEWLAIVLSRRMCVAVILPLFRNKDTFDTFGKKRFRAV